MTENSRVNAECTVMSQHRLITCVFLKSVLWPPSAAPKVRSRVPGWAAANTSRAGATSSSCPTPSHHTPRKAPWWRSLPRPPTACTSSGEPSCFTSETSVRNTSRASVVFMLNQHRCSWRITSLNNLNDRCHDRASVWNVWVLKSLCHYSPAWKFLFLVNICLIILSELLIYFSNWLFKFPMLAKDRRR